MWPFRPIPQTAQVALQPLTLGRYLALQATLLRGVELPCVEVGGEEVQVYVPLQPNPAACDRETLLAFVDEACKNPPERFATDEALRSFAVAVWGAVEGEMGRATVLAAGQAEYVEAYTGQYLGGGPESDRAEPPLGHMVGCMEPPHYVAIRDLPLWEGLFVLRCRNVILTKQEADRKGGDDDG